MAMHLPLLYAAVVAPLQFAAVACTLAGGAAFVASWWVARVLRSEDLRQGEEWR